MLSLEQLVSICDILGLSPVQHSGYVRTCVDRLVSAVGQAGIDMVENILELVATLDEVSLAYASDANSTLTQADGLKWSEGGRQAAVMNKRLEYSRRLGVLLDIDPGLRQAGSGQYAGFTPTFRA